MVSRALTAQPSHSPPAKLIDVHLHIWEPMPASAGSRDSLVAAFKRFNLVRAVASGPIPLVRQLRDLAPDRIIGGAIFTESIKLPPIPDLERILRSREIEVLGEIDAQYAGVRLDAQWLDPYWTLAEKLGVPVAIHTGFGQPSSTEDPCCPLFRASLGNPLHIEEALARHPKLRVYLMHAGWPYLAETKAIMQLYPRVYADLAAFAFNPGIPRPEFYHYLEDLVRAGFGKRLMFGSGLSPKDWAGGIGVAIELINQAPFLTPEQKNDIFHDNAARFLQQTSVSTLRPNTR
jgi:predicted TIM-barrel fold metal-dependent hydrolase